MGVLLGNGDGTFQSVVLYPTGATEGRGVAVGDFNGDGKPDLAVTSRCLTISCTSGAVSILLGNGDGTFKTAVPYATGGINAFNVVVADMNGDSKEDLVVANRCTLSGCPSSGTVGVLLGNGDGTFQAATSFYTSGIYAQALTVGDVDGDGKLDVVVADQCQLSGLCASEDSPVFVLIGNGDGTLQPPQQYLTGGQPAYSVALGDLNEDGHPDIVVANQCLTPTNCTNGGVAVLLNNGNGTFQSAVNYAATGNTTSWVDIADVDGDGHADVVAVNYCVDSTCNTDASVDLMFGSGDGTLQAPQTYSTGGANSYMATLGDVNGDGRLDVVTANECRDCTDGSVSVLLSVAFGVTGTALNPPSVLLGQSATSTITITPAQGYTGTVNLTCTVTGVQNPPQTPAPTCSFDKSSITGGSGTATLTVTTVGSTQSAASEAGSHFIGNLGAAWLPAMGLSILGLCVGSSRTRCRTHLGLWLLMFAAFMILTSCGAGSSGGSGGGGGGGGGGGCSSCTAVGNYNVAVTASDSTNSKDIVSISPPLTLNVQ